MSKTLKKPFLGRTIYDEVVSNLYKDKPTKVAADFKIRKVTRFRSECHAIDRGRTARGGHVLLEVSPGPAMPSPPTPCGRATPETALRAILYPFGHPTPCA
jgi:hypothetical protein